MLFFIWQEGQNQNVDTCMRTNFFSSLKEKNRGGRFFLQFGEKVGSKGNIIEIEQSHFKKVAESVSCGKNTID